MHEYQIVKVWILFDFTHFLAVEVSLHHVHLAPLWVDTNTVETKITDKNPQPFHIIVSALWIAIELVSFSIFSKKDTPLRLTTEYPAPSIYTQPIHAVKSVERERMVKTW